jgi:hypothetical protein
LARRTAAACPTVQPVQKAGVPLERRLLLEKVKKVTLY